VLFQGEGFRRLGVRGYLGKFFPIGEFRHGIGAGLLALYVGIIELLPGVREAGNAGYATLRQHLRRRSSSGRHLGPDPGSHSVALYGLEALLT